MGYLHALELASSDMDLETQVRIHLTSNCYPPAGGMTDPCVAAIQAAYDDDFDREIALPEGATWKGNTAAPASAIIDNFRLEAWLEESEDN